MYTLPNSRAAKLLYPIGSGPMPTWCMYCTTAGLIRKRKRERQRSKEPHTFERPIARAKP